MHIKFAHPVALHCSALAGIPEFGGILVVGVVLRVRQHKPIHLHVQSETISLDDKLRSAEGGRSQFHD